MAGFHKHPADLGSFDACKKKLRTPFGRPPSTNSRQWQQLRARMHSMLLTLCITA